MVSDPTTTAAHVLDAICTFFSAWTHADAIAAFGALTAFVGVLIVFKQLRGLSRQISLQQYSDYTKRYQQIVLRFPEDINSSEFELQSHPQHDSTMRQIRAYMDLCYEEWFLNKNRLIDPKFWEVWKGGMQFAFSKPAFKQAWSTIRKDSKFPAQFERFVDDAMGVEDPLGPAH